MLSITLDLPTCGQCSLQFESFGAAGVTLFSISSADSLRDTFASLSAAYPWPWLAQLYLYVFVSMCPLSSLEVVYFSPQLPVLVVMVILKLFINIIQFAYVRVRRKSQRSSLLGSTRHEAEMMAILDLVSRNTFEMQPRSPASEGSASVFPWTATSTSSLASSTTSLPDASTPLRATGDGFRSYGSQQTNVLAPASAEQRTPPLPPQAASTVAAADARPTTRQELITRLLETVRGNQEAWLATATRNLNTGPAVS